MTQLWKQIADHATEWAKEAGKIQLSYFRGHHLEITTKTSLHDVVTVADKESEKFIMDKISEFYPNHTLLGEESGLHAGSSDYQWVIDPLDGTNNFSQGLPIFCVSIGIQYKNETIIGVVYLPYLGELFTAIRGQGAFLDGKRIQVGKKDELRRSVVATGFPYDKDVNPDNNINNVARIVPQVRGIRRMGAAAYDLCCVAAGFLDGYWEFNLQPWDVCAGALIVEEAGGIVVPFRQDRGIAIMAGNQSIVLLLQKNIATEGIK